ncbi:MAG: hypothetical protein IEMM0008_1487 [bacterium]|nr:MAG: hypothetical protein IEMM0008_1487 [bacterium]
MKKRASFVFLIAIGITMLFLSFYATVDRTSAGEKYEFAGSNSPCYGCRGGGYVCYSGKDSVANRKKAKKKYGCKVSGTASCSKHRCNGKYI